ncbi:hypothetical protein SVIOM74S_04123 [Streptomyces violarus]
MTPASVEVPLRPARPCGAAAAMTWLHFAPAAMVAVRVAGSIRTSVMRAVLINRPFSMGKLAPWPVAWTATGVSVALAQRMAVTMSSGPVAPTTTSGVWRAARLKPVTSSA